MGRRKRRRPRRATRAGAAHEAASDSEEVFDLEIVDDRASVPHPLEDVASALETGKVVNPASAASESGEHTSDAVDAASPEASVSNAASEAVSSRSAEKNVTHEQATAAQPETAASSVALEEAPEQQVAPEPDPGHDVQTLGELLQQARESRGLSIEETSARTRISLKMLGHLENDRFGEFAADAYVKGFLRNYGTFLGLDVEMLVRRFETLSGQPVVVAPAVWEEVVEKRRPRKRWKPQRRTLAGIGVVVMLATLAWVFWSRGAARLGLRPTPGLEQIENELREAPERKPRVQAGIDAAPLKDAPDAAAANDPSVAAGGPEGEVPTLGSTSPGAASLTGKPSATTAPKTSTAAAEPTTTSTPSRPTTSPASATTTQKPSTTGPQRSTTQERAPETRTPQASGATTPAAKPKPPAKKPASTTEPAAKEPEPTQPAAKKPQAQKPAAKKPVAKPKPPATKPETKPAPPPAKPPRASAPKPPPKPKPKPPASGDSRPPPPEPADPPH